MSTAIQLDVLGGALVSPPTHKTPVRAHLRRVKGAPPPSGIERKDAALAQHEQKETVRVAKEYLRDRLRDLYRARALADPVGASVTADDIDELLKAWPACPRVLLEGRQAWRGTVFAGKGWQLTGETKRSTRPAMNAHRNPCWRPVQADAAHPTQRRSA